MKIDSRVGQDSAFTTKFLMNKNFGNYIGFDPDNHCSIKNYQPYLSNKAKSSISV